MRKDVQRAIEKFEIKTFGSKRDIEKGEKLIKNDENVLFVTPTSLNIINVGASRKEKHGGAIFLTNKRILFFSGALSSSNIDSISLDEIRSIDYSNLVTINIRIHSLTKIYDFTVSSKKQNLTKIQKEFENAKKKFYQINYTNSNDSNIIEQIEKLAALREKGIITEIEFENKKSDLLSRL